MSENHQILVIDDEQVVLHAISRIASAEGLSVDCESNAKSALQKLGQKKYSLILCDIMMPELDGFMFLEEMRKRNISTPVIMITGFSTVENAVDSLYNGAVDFIPKPFTFEELKSSISRGLKFYTIQQKIQNEKFRKDKGTIAFVSGPPKYFRLGNQSWMNLEPEGIATIGAADLYLETIEKLVSIELMDVDEIIIQGESCANFLTLDDLTHHFLSPVSGRIIDRNKKLLTDVDLIEKDPYFEGWIYKVIPSNIEYEMKKLVPFASDRI